MIGLLAEISVNPFGTAFRFSLGPVGLALLALFDWLPAYVAGVATGLVVPLVHGILAFISSPHVTGAGLVHAIASYVPETLAYTVLGALLFAFRVHDRSATSPPQAAVLLALADILTNLTELVVRPDHFHIRTVAMIVMVALGRACVALGAYYVLQEGVRQREWQRERQSYMERLLFAANLQTEAFFLKKSAREIEQIMAKAHRLYRDLTGQPGQSLALEIAKDIHEVKKDYQRTLSALHRIIETPKLAREMNFSEIVGLVFEANRTYAVTLGKQITFVPNLQVDFRSPRFGRWVSILNNLVSNGIEACGAQGTVTLSAARLGDRFVLAVADTGSGIPPEDWELVFSPGFTTKANPVTGAFSNGIGLTHVAGLVRSMDGLIRVDRSDSSGTRFRLEVPWDSLESVARKE